MPQAVNSPPGRAGLGHGLGSGTRPKKGEEREGGEKKKEKEGEKEKGKRGEKSYIDRRGILDQRRTFWSLNIAHLADIPLRHVATTLVVGGPQNPKDLGFGGFSPLRFCSCRPFGLKTPCRTRKSDSPTFLLKKSVVADFLS